MSNTNSNPMSGSRSDRANISSGGQGDSGITDKVKNLVTPESHAAGMMGMGGMGGPGGAAAASALGSNVPSVPSHSGGMSNVDSPHAHAFNRDSSHSGFGGHNPTSDSYGRDTTNSETYGRGASNIGGSQDYSMSSDRDQVRRNTNQGALGTGNMTSSGMDSSGLGTASGITDGSDSRHQTVDANSRLRTDSTRTGVNSGSGVHAHQFSGRSGGASTMSGMGSGMGQRDLQDEHHLHGAGGAGNLETGCSKCHPDFMRDSSTNTTTMPSSTIQERTGMGGHSLGKYETSTNTGMGGSFGQERMNLGDDSMGKYETSTTSSGMGGIRAHERGTSSGYGTSGNTHDVSSQSAEGMKTQPPFTGPVGSSIGGQQVQGGSASMTDKIIGGAEKVTGKMTGNSDMVNEGEMRAAGNFSGVSRN